MNAPLSRHWTVEEEKRCLELYRRGISCNIIAHTLGRAEHGVRCRLAKYASESVRRLDRKYAANLEEHTFSAEQLFAMDDAFQARMLWAISKGLERPKIGTVTEPGTRNPVRVDPINWPLRGSVMSDTADA